MSESTDTIANNTRAWLVIGSVLAVLLIAGAMIGGGTSTAPRGKPVMGTPACKDAQLAYTHTLPDRRLYDDAEFEALAANIDDICDQPADRITH